MTGYIKDLSGQTFGRWKVLSYVGVNKHQKAKWLCICQCGVKREVIGSNLKSGISYSCGCYEKELKTTHGKWNTPEYRAWQDMKDRCSNKNNKFYKDYGGRGITVCDKWLSSFEYFYNDMCERPTRKHSLDRINVDKGYGPDNCRWADVYVQQRNKRNNTFISTEWGLITIAEASERSGIAKSTIRARIRRGVSKRNLLNQTKILNPKTNETN